MAEWTWLLQPAVEYILANAGPATAVAFGASVLIAVLVHRRRSRDLRIEATYSDDDTPCIGYALGPTPGAACTDRGGVISNVDRTWKESIISFYDRDDHKLWQGRLRADRDGVARMRFRRWKRP